MNNLGSYKRFLLNRKNCVCRLCKCEDHCGQSCQDCEYCPDCSCEHCENYVIGEN